MRIRAGESPHLIYGLEIQNAIHRVSQRNFFSFCVTADVGNMNFASASEREIKITESLALIKYIGREPKARSQPNLK